MPTYDYRCNGCGHEFELFQSMSAPHKRKCPECKKNTLERLIGTGAAVLFKGSGFYETDYRSESYKKAAEADKPSDSSAKKDDKKAKTEPKAAASESKKSGEASTKKTGAKKPTGKKA